LMSLLLACSAGAGFASNFLAVSHARPLYRGLI
jgi:hypothetical protein